MDHSILTKIFKQPSLNARQAWWTTFLSEFDCDIKHLKGKENCVVNALSRKLQCLYEVSCSELENPLGEMIIRAAGQDATYQQIKQQVQQPTRKEEQPDYVLDAVGLLYYKKRLYVPNQNNIKNLILDEYQKSHYVGHPGYQKMITALKK